MMHSSWFDRLTKRTLLLAITTATFLTHADSLLAEEDLVAVHLGPATFAVPPGWLELEDDDIEHGVVATVILTPPPVFFDGTNGVSTDGIADIVILLRHKAIDAGPGVSSIDLSLDVAAGKYGVARPEDAAIAFDGIGFDTLRGGPTANAGKSATQPLILIGSVESPRYGTMLVSTRMEQPYSNAPQRRYIISADIDAYDAQFDVIIQLEASRMLRAADLGIVDTMVGVLTEGAPD